jgi:hypothetical protein
MVRVVESLAGGWEHAAFGVDLLTEVLGLDEGVVTTVFADLGFYEAQVFGDFHTDIFGGDFVKALLAIGRIFECITLRVFLAHSIGVFYNENLDCLESRV